MKQETLMKNINELLEIMPWYVKEYYQAKLVIPYSYKTLYEYLKEYRRFFAWLISDHEKSGETVRYAYYDTIADVHIDELAHLPKSVIEAYFVYLRENTELRMLSQVYLSILPKKLRMTRVSLIFTEMSWLRSKSKNLKIPWLVVLIT